MPTIKPPAVAGQFYPDDAACLAGMIKKFIDEARPVSALPKAIIAPHAGYIYSGPIAGSAYQVLKVMRGQIKRIILLGPAHRLYFRGIALHSADFFETPLGCVALDKETLKSVSQFPKVILNDAAFEKEHSLEVHLPFLQQMFSIGFGLVPLLVGDSTPDEVANILEALWGDSETLVIVSSDLSHYHTYQEAQTLDKKTAQAIVQQRSQNIPEEGACGRIPIKALLSVANRHSLHTKLIDLRNSGDTAGDKSKVVGYGAFHTF